MDEQYAGIKYIVSDVDVWADLVKEIEGTPSIGILDSVEDAERFAIEACEDSVLAIHRYIDRKHNALLSVVWEDIIFDKRE